MMMKRSRADKVLTGGVVLVALWLHGSTYAQLDESWTVTVNGQSVQVETNGSFRIANIAAPDLFGTNGPGSAPDLMSDDFLIVTGVSTAGGTTRYALSGFFQITQGEPFVVGTLTITATPPPFPETIRITVDPAVLTVGQTTQLTVTATLADTTTRDVTARSEWTVYRTSNPDLATVGQDGLVTADAVGPVLITATNTGATAVGRVDVVTALIATTVEGFVQLADQTPLQAASVSVTTELNGSSSLAGSTMTNVDGFFSVPLTDIPIEAGLRMHVIADIAGQLVVSTADDPLIVPDGFTDAGILMVQPLVVDAFSRRLSVYNAPDAGVFDSFSRAFSVYNTPDDSIDDAFSRQFSVFACDAADCPPLCGDGTCDPNEHGCSCAADCGDPPGNEVVGSSCDDGVDNDCDGLTDCDDPDCASEPTCPFCGDGLCDPGEDSCNCTGDCGAPPATEMVGLTCDDGLDNDCDGLADCDDPDCFDDPVCQFCGNARCDPGENRCTCGQDCGAPPATEMVGSTCDDGLDNDCDTLTDCDDADCLGDPACPMCDNDGACELGENCETCENDCQGRTTGQPSGRFCCGNGVLEGPEGDGSICDGNP